MSYVDNWVDAICDDELNPVSQIAVLFAHTLAKFADWETGTDAWPSNATLAAKMHCSPRSVRVARSELVEAGWLRIEVGVGPGGTTIQHLITPK